uniref:CitMHS domain-containing protein n=1 Tax=Macrostomum lignano TaxID=282301 RepID=A0A1I8GYD7_9PLAT
MPSKLYSYKSSEREPLLLKQHQPAVTNQPKPLSALRIDSSKLPKDNYSSTDFLDLKRIRRTGIYYAKTGSVFLLAIICCTIIAATPEKTPLVHLYTVSSVRAPTINVTPSIEAYSVLLVRIKGALLYSSGRDSANLTVTVDRQLPDDNSVETRNWTVPIQPTFVNDLSKEIVREMYFPIGQKAHRDRDRLSIRLSTEYPHSLPIVLAYETLADAIHNEVLYAGIVLAFVYGLITLELAHRALAAMLGLLMSVAALSLVNRRPSLAEVIAWLDFETLSLLFGMMVMVGIFSESGFFDWLAVAAYRLARGRKAALTALLCLFAGGASAFLDNVTTILLMAPVTIRLCELLRLDPRQLLIAQVMFSNIGGAATAVGDPPNVIIASNAQLEAQGVTFAGFTLHMTLGALPAALAAYVLFQTVYWRDNVKSESSTENGDSAVADELRREAEVWRRTAYGFSVTTREQAAVKAMLQARICELEHRMVATTERPSTSGVSRDDSLRTFEQNLIELQQKYKIRDKELLVKCCLVLMGVVALFFVSSTVPSLHLDLVPKLHFNQSQRQFMKRIGGCLARSDRRGAAVLAGGSAAGAAGAAVPAPVVGAESTSGSNRSLGCAGCGVRISRCWFHLVPSLSSTACAGAASYRTAEGRWVPRLQVRRQVADLRDSGRLPAKVDSEAQLLHQVSTDDVVAAWRNEEPVLHRLVAVAHLQLVHHQADSGPVRSEFQRRPDLPVATRHCVDCDHLVRGIDSSLLAATATPEVVLLATGVACLALGRTGGRRSVVSPTACAGAAGFGRPASWCWAVPPLCSDLLAPRLSDRLDGCRARGFLDGDRDAERFRQVEVLHLLRQQPLSDSGVTGLLSQLVSDEIVLYRAVVAQLRQLPQGCHEGLDVLAG